MMMTHNNKDKNPFNYSLRCLLRWYSPTEQNEIRKKNIWCADQNHAFRAQNNVCALLVCDVHSMNLSAHFFVFFVLLTKLKKMSRSLCCSWNRYKRVSMCNAHCACRRRWFFCCYIVLSARYTKCMLWFPIKCPILCLDKRFPDARKISSYSLTTMLMLFAVFRRRTSKCIELASFGTYAMYVGCMYAVMRCLFVYVTRRPWPGPNKNLFIHPNSVAIHDNYIQLKSRSGHHQTDCSCGMQSNGGLRRVTWTWIQLNDNFQRSILKKKKNYCGTIFDEVCMTFVALKPKRIDDWKRPGVN